MNVDRAVLGFAGVMILISVVLTQLVHPNWMWLTVFVAANLLQSSLTGFCPAAVVMAKLGIKSGCAFK